MAGTNDDNAKPAERTLKKKEGDSDWSSIKKNVSIGAIVALILSVFHFTYFVMSHLNEMNEKIYEIRSKNEILMLKFDHLEKEIDDTGRKNEKVTDKLYDIENFVNKIDTQLKNGK